MMGAGTQNTGGMAGQMPRPEYAIRPQPVAGVPGSVAPPRPPPGGKGGQATAPAPGGKGGMPNAGGQGISSLTQPGGMPNAGGQGISALTQFGGLPTLPGTGGQMQPPPSLPGTGGQLLPPGTVQGRMLDRPDAGGFAAYAQRQGLGPNKAGMYGPPGGKGGY